MRLYADRAWLSNGEGRHARGRMWSAVLPAGSPGRSVGQKLCKILTGCDMSMDDNIDSTGLELLYLRPESPLQTYHRITHRVLELGPSFTVFEAACGDDMTDPAAPPVVQPLPIERATERCLNGLLTSLLASIRMTGCSHGGHDTDAATKGTTRMRPRRPRRALWWPWPMWRHGPCDPWPPCSPCRASARRGCGHGGPRLPLD